MAQPMKRFSTAASCHASSHQPSRMLRFRPPLGRPFMPLAPLASWGRSGVLSQRSEPCTSGMKVLPNGGLNLSILDGWWDEAWQDAAVEKRFIGWAIGNGESYDNPDDQDQVESSALYSLLERDIVPGFYERSADGLPRRW